MYLCEQLKVIQKEFGDDVVDENVEFWIQVEKVDLFEEVYWEVDCELVCFECMGCEVMEFQVICSFVEIVFEFFWYECSVDQFELSIVVVIFEVDYYGLSDVKDCIFEFLVVCQFYEWCFEDDVLVDVVEVVGKEEDCGDLCKSLILFFIGFLGVGKILIVKLIVKLMGCEYVCIVFGGVWDEVDICGY